MGWLWSVSSVVVDAVTARAAERQLTLRSAERRARVGGEAAGRRTLLLGQTRKKSPDTFSSSAVPEWPVKLLEGTLPSSAGPKKES